MNDFILYPFQYSNDNRYSYAFALELARFYKTGVITVTALEGHNKFTKENEFKEYLSEEKEKTHHHLLSLNGYYQVFFNRFAKQESIHVKNIIGEKSMPEAISDALTVAEIVCAVVDHKYVDVFTRMNQAGFKEANISLKCLFLPSQFSFNMPSEENDFFPEGETGTFLDKVLADCDILEVQPASLTV